MMRPENMVGQTLGHYHIVRSIGRGGMATVFLAQDIHLQREVAVKLFWPKPGETRDFLRRFIREARILAQIDHPNILPVYDYGEQDGRAYLVTPYMAGGTLKDMLQAHKRLPPVEAVRLTIQILNALQYAHERGLIHRDIKPANILFKADGTLLLSDFGLVKVLSGDGESGLPNQSVSQTGQMIAGTPEYMSPEQIHGKATPSSDIYSVGIVLYEMLTGIRPFTSDSVMSVLLKHLHEQPRSIREIEPQVSPQLEAVVLRALEKDPSTRYQRPTDFIQALIQATTPHGLTNAANWATSPVHPVRSAPPVVLREAGPIDPAVHLDLGYTIQEMDTGVVDNRPEPGQDEGAPGQYSLPRPRKRSRFPIVLAVVMALIIIGSGIGVLLSPLGHSLFAGAGASPTASVPTIGSHGGGITPSSTTVTTLNVPPTSTTCPPAGTARAEVTAPLAPGHDPNIIYIVNEGSSNAPTFGTVKRYDTVTGAKTEIAKTASTRIDSAQVSADGQWTLFTAQVSGQSELRMVRMDGQGLQTLLCAPAGQHISGAQWSIDQKSVVFDEGPDIGAPTLYLLNVTNGTLQKELVPSSSGIAYTPRTWLDNTRVLMVGFVPNSDAPQQNLYILDTGKGANQQSTDLQQVVTLSQPCWDFDTNNDGTQLFVSQCTPGQQGSGTVSIEPSTGGALTTILSSSTLAIASMRVIDPGNTNLLLEVSNTGPGVNGDTSKDGLWRVKTDGSNLIRLTANVAGEISSLNQFSQYFWSNFSRDFKMYALQTTNPATNTYTLLFGSLSGGTPTTFASISGTVLEIAGWTNL